MESVNFSTVFSKEFVVAFLVLVLFGVFYNQVVEKFQKRTQRYTAELVVIGVLVTLVASAFVIGWLPVLVVSAFFIASGSPMIIGSWIRTARDEDHTRQLMKDKLDGKKS